MDPTEFGDYYFGVPNGRDKPGKTLNPKDRLLTHFSGWAVTLEQGATVASVEAYYVDGKPSEHNPGLSQEELDKGYPVSGDYSRRFQHWRNTGHWPTYADMPDVKPIGAIF